ncbi:MAG: hypothetical protein FWG77_10110 [Treponema sp.]|nr:hypothetical protein [Treponema sp.]
MAHAGKTLTEQEYTLLDELGVVWVLDTFYWRNIESEQGVFDFSRYDAYVNKAISEGKKIIAVLAYDTPWLNNGRRRYISPGNTPYFLRYVEETVRHFKGRVDVWSVWNEPNIVFWRGTNREFYELSRLATQRIRETDPDAYIIGGVFWRSPASFIRGMHRASAIEGLDGISFHPYALNPIGSAQVHDRFNRILSSIDYSKPVWVSEIGYPTAGWIPLTVKPEDLPSYVVKTIVNSAVRGARTLIWYELFDGFNRGEIPRDQSLTFITERSYGLVYPDFERKSGAHSYELCARYLPDSFYLPQLPKREDIPSNIVSFYFINASTGISTLILWNDRLRPGSFALHLPTDALKHDISTGMAQALPSNSILEINRVPLFITWSGSGIPVLLQI